MPTAQGPCPMDPGQMETTLQRLASDLLARVKPEEELVLLGIRSRGLPLAERLATLLRASTGAPVPVGALDITLYRDDLTEMVGSPIVRPTEIPFTLTGRTVVLVDDVLYTGRTVRAALDALLDHGRPRRVMLLVMADRSGRELPIQADLVGVRVEIPPGHRVAVRVKEIDGADGVTVEAC
ncbi:bifunctional pyr operon transcriptional regulator/uracil phosphoribosyltransferase PyrR [Geothrix sp. PMB-07]|uniref:bifunctional pyr operon transcriptional regulator/uracil phosphoribosyltransferase PyrR n=1 Tax=Geothrix sp. PMB-07 TaxID=3068640 RepID=UPI0027404BF5|nr:bifunctional pyr operon transcriptional regulator/uracil phosphoribosyltransferase PyrR [Geothrix sp. PMB-07]WLT30732.1 bifunctional pyr operon transcriptional regulator/uracil phosphoribosyltransferase PyrR [Geothrix sp. PMB-07]